MARCEAQDPCARRRTARTLRPKGPLPGAPTRGLNGLAAVVRGGCVTALTSGMRGCGCARGWGIDGERGRSWRRSSPCANRDNDEDTPGISDTGSRSGTLTLTALHLSLCSINSVYLPGTRVVHPEPMQGWSEDRTRTAFCLTSVKKTSVRALVQRAVDGVADDKFLWLVRDAWKS